MAARTTPEQICDYLSTHPAASARELSRVLNLTVPNIRHHLEQLVRVGRVVKIGKRPGAGRGRPTEYYALDLETRENNFAGLSAALLVVLTDECSQAESEERCRKVAHSLAAPFSERPSSLVSRLNRAVLHLNQMRYHARWEAHAGGPRFYIEYCPYQAIAGSHPQICQIDRCLLETLLQAPCRQIERMQSGSLKPTHCVFTVQAV